MEEYKELVRSIESVRDGQWLPITVLALCFTVIISLLLYIWNKTQKANDERHKISEQRHDKTSEILEKVSDAQQQTAVVVAKLEARSEVLEKFASK